MKRTVMNLKIKLPVFFLEGIMVILLLTGCSQNHDLEDLIAIDGTPGNNTSTTDDGSIPDFDATIVAWEGETADDAASDVVGTDKDFYHELNTFSNTVTVVYNETTATVTSSNPQINTYVSGAYVTVDMQTNSVSDTEIILKGKTSDGGLKIYGSNKFKLLMQGVDITSQRGPAINSQCKKRIYVHLEEGTSNYLTDTASYSDDTYYLDGESSSTEDRKGCFFSEGNLVFSGSGALVVAGKYKHGIVTDGYLYMRPGVTLVVTEAAKNAVHVKGDDDDGIGVYMAGGMIYANVTSTAGKGIKTDLDVEVAGGKLLLNTSGNATYDADEGDTSSAAGIKTDGNVIISGGIHVMKSTSTGGKGINADGTITITGGTTTVTTTGGKYTYSNSLTSSPKGVKADGDIDISGGNLNISVTGISNGSEGLESKATLTISGGEVYVYAYDDAINASSAINISGGKVYAYGSNNDGIDSNGSLTISGGLVIGCGAGSPESGIDVDNSNNFKINGGIVIGIGGTLQSTPSSSSSQRSVIYNGITATKDSKVCVLDSYDDPILTFEFPRTQNSASLFFSTPAIVSGESYTISSGGTLTSYTASWNGWFEGGTWTDGTELETFTSSNTVTTIGNSNGNMGGGPGGNMNIPGGWRP